MLALAARSIAIAITARQRSELSTTGLTIVEDALDAASLDRVRRAMDIVVDEVRSVTGATVGSAISRRNGVCGCLPTRGHHAQASAPSLRSQQAAAMPKQAA